MVTEVASHFCSGIGGTQLCPPPPAAPDLTCGAVYLWRHGSGGRSLGTPPPLPSQALRTQPCSQDRQVTDGDWDYERGWEELPTEIFPPSP